METNADTLIFPVSYYLIINIGIFFKLSVERGDGKFVIT